MNRVSHPSVTELDQARALPRLDALAARALNRLYDRRTASIDLKLRGEPARLHWDVAALPAVHDTYRFKLGMHAGCLGLDAAAQTLLLDERRCDLLLRELRYVLLADALHEVVESLEAAFRLRFEWLPEDESPARAGADPGPAAPFELRLLDSGGRSCGFVRFDEPAALDAFVPIAAGRGGPAVGSGFDTLRVGLNFCLGTTRIRLHEVRKIRPGDIVSLEAWNSAGGGLLLTAELGAPAGWQLIGLAEGTRITLQQTRDIAMNRDALAPPAADDQDSVGQPIDRLDALEVTLRFEVGELSVSLGELKNLRTGHVFELAQPLNRSPVRILAHGNVLGKGYLVAVGDRLGVRVSEFAPSEL